MNSEQFRRLALSMPESREGEHMQHPDFRANDRIFATLHPDGKWGMVKLAPADQERLVHDHPDEFVPANGAWGRAGCTNVLLATVDPAVLRDAMTLAWQVAAQAPSKKRPAPRPKASKGDEPEPKKEAKPASRVRRRRS
ncbi:MAG: MmcQ/YjbR family DNA-binding protein [Planctomycetota bacterium]